MKRVGRWGIGLLTAIVLIGLIGYTDRESIALKAVSLLMDQRIKVGPFQEIAWEMCADPEGRTPGNRPPNIILILADDLGWNDLSFAGGGVAGGTVPTPNIGSIAAIDKERGPRNKTGGGQHQT